LEEETFITSFAYFLYRDEVIDVANTEQIDLDKQSMCIRSAVESLGIKRVIDEVGLSKVIDEVGLSKVIDEVGIQKVFSELTESQKKELRELLNE